MAASSGDQSSLMPHRQAYRSARFAPKSSALTFPKDPGCGDANAAQKLCISRWMAQLIPLQSTLSF